METTKQRLKGHAEQLSGKAQKAVGRIGDRDDIAARGEREESIGEARVAVADAVDRAKEKLSEAAEKAKAGAERVAGNVAKKVSELTGSSDTNTQRSRR